MVRISSRSAPKALRNAATSPANRFSSTIRPCQTCFSNSSLLTTAPGGFDQRQQHIEGTATECDRPAVGEKLAAMRQDAEVAEFDDRRRFGQAKHGGDYKPYSIKSQIFAARARGRATASHRAHTTPHNYTSSPKDFTS